MGAVVIDHLLESGDRRRAIAAAVMKQDHRMLLGEPERGSLPDDTRERAGAFGRD
jgi:hypothetical protein